MIVSHIILKNWRNFREVDVSLKDRVFVIGPNASGKSNLLDAFKFLRDIAKSGGGLQKAVSDRGGLSKIRCLAARKDPDVEIKVTLSDYPGDRVLWQYAIGIKQEPRGHRQPYLTYERVIKEGKAIVDRPNEEDKGDQLRLTQTYLEQINANVDFREIARYLEGVLYLHLVPQLVRNPDAFSGPGVPGDPFGRNFLERVAGTSEKTRRARLRKIEEALRIAVPQLEHLKDVRDERGIPHLEVIYKHWRPQGAKQREDQFSDGTLRLLGLLWSLLEGDSLLLIEEPELSLNVGVVSKMSPLIYRLQKQKRRQVIISTHSLELLSDKGIGGKEALLLTPGEEGTTVRLAASMKDVDALLKGGMAVGEAISPHIMPPHYNQLELFK
jgi:predicted ATPase